MPRRINNAPRPQRTTDSPRPRRPPKPAKPATPAAPSGWTPAARGGALDKALADKRVTDGEWSRLGPQLAKTELGAPETRQLLEAYANQGISFEPSAAAQAHDVLVDKGYDIPGRQPGAGGQWVAPKVNLEHITEGNVAETDATFEKLSSVVGGGTAQLRVAIVDGGFVAHPILQDNLVGDAAASATGHALGKEFGRFTDLERQQGSHHGTHVAGIATRGTSRIQASLFAIPLDVPDDPQAANKPRAASPLPRALEAAAKSGASVVNVSIESFVSPAEAERYKKVMEKFPDTLFVFGAGNDQYELGSATEGDKSVVESFKLPNMMVVGATNPDGGRWGRSNYSGKWVDVATRGHAINSASSTGPGLIQESGTSMAAPNASNLGAKCRLLHPALTPAQVVKLLSVTSDEHYSWKDQVASGGPVNAQRAMHGAAALALMAKGDSLPQALAKLGLPADEQARLSSALARL